MFPPLNKNYLKNNCDFYLTIERYEVRIVRNKVAIVRYKVPILRNKVSIER